MKLSDSRRLTGPNLLTRGPAALVEVVLDPGESSDAAVAAWRTEVERLHGALGLPVPAIAIRIWPGGAACALPGAIDELLALTLVNDFAIESAVEILAGRPPLPLDAARTAIALELARSRNPSLLALQAEASRRGLPFLWDDELVSVGAGQFSRDWPIREIPPCEAIPWAELGTIPIALITGTNGKTTSSRLLARIVRSAGLVAGSTSTEGVTIGDRVIEAGDWTGPDAARLVLRRPDVEVAVLETARGGILRRGLAVDACDGALITNVGSDHFGPYGVGDLATMARTKAVIGSVVRPGGRVVLNGDDAILVALARTFQAEVVLFSTDAASPSVVAHRGRGGEAWIVRDGALVQARGEVELALLPVVEIPITFGGAARYNVENALGVAALATGLGLPRAAIAAGLRSFASGATDNPGRGNLFDVAGVRVLVDFGHNREAVRGVLALVDRLREGRGRLTVVTGAAGDRSDEDFRDVAREIHAHAPHRVLLRDLPDYLRGREPGVVPAIFRAELLRLGMAASAIAIAVSEAEALGRALDEAEPDDFIALLVHLDTDAVAALLSARGARPR
ncbi:MAG: Mur ligase [Myxococcales bacterium]|nr:Mur ligase [Myxococcales bacterium]